MDIPEEVVELNKSIVDTLKTLLNIFIEEGCTKLPTFKYWYAYVNAVESLLNDLYMYAERVGDWKQHLCCRAMMLPCLFAVNKHNYSKWFHVYLLVPR